MSEDSSEQLYGRAETERSAGNEPMPVSHPVSNLDDVPTESMVTDDDVAHLNRPESPAPLDRSYRDVGSGEEIDPKFTVSKEQAASDLARARESDRKIVQDQDAEDLRLALDQLHGDQNQQPANQSPEAPQPETFEPQPEQADPDAAYAQAQATISEADKKIQEFLQDPYVRDRVEREFSAVTQQAAAQVQQAKTVYEQGLAQNAAAALAVLTTSFPEFAGLSGPELQGALRVSNPQRAEAFRSLVGQVNTVVGQFQQQAAQQQQAQRQQAEIQQRQAAETFQRYAAEQDAKALAKETPESLAQIRNVLYEDGKKAGFSKADIDQAWNTIPALRNAFVSELIADGAKYRMSQRALATHRHNPVQKVQRPGVSSGEPRDDDSAYASLERQFRGKDLTAKQAADLLTAHRARR